jgi:hypothetical protein
MQWGLVPLSAACVSRGGRGLLIASAAAGGKSAMALALVRLGLRFCADDLCALERGDDGALRLWPSRPQMRLWRDALAALDEPEPPEPPTPGDRLTLPMGDVFEPAPVAPAAMVWLQFANGPSFEPVLRRAGVAAFEAAMRLPALPEPGHGRGAMQGRLRAMAALAGAANVMEFRRVEDLSRIGEDVARLVAALPPELVQCPARALQSQGVT